MSHEDIIDNRSVQFVNEIKKFLKYTKDAKFATGYFYLNGFDLVKENLQDTEQLKILMGDETTRATRDELTKGYEEKEEIIRQMSEDIEKADEDQIRKIKELHDLIREEVVDVKIYIKDKFHSKLYLFSRPDAENPRIAIIRKELAEQVFSKPINHITKVTGIGKVD